jgi:hypothetical protein
LREVVYRACGDDVKHVFVDHLPEDGVTGATDALSATSEEAVTGVEADGALGGDKGGREGSEEDGELHVDGRFRWWWCLG